MTSPDPIRRNSYLLLAAFLVLTAGIAASGYRYYVNQKSGIEAGVRNQLGAIADLKARQVATWRKERLADARIIAATQMFPALRQVLEGTANPPAAAQVLAWMQEIREGSGYANTILVSAQGRLRLSIGKTGAETHYSALMDRIRQTGGIVFSDLHFDEGLSGPHMGLNVPLRFATDGEPQGGLLLGIDPNQFLYPLIQSWPTPSRTAETLLIRREGGEIVYLNELRHRKGTALRLRFPLTDKQLPAVQAALGREGIVDGVDYRGVPVLAAFRKVPDSPWILLSKVDVEEVYGPVREQAFWLALAMCSLTLATGSIGGLVWRHLRARFYQQKYEAELQRRRAEESLRQSEERFKQLVENAPDGIFVQTENRFRYLNAAALRLFGASSAEQLLDEPVIDRCHPDSRAAAAERLRLLNDARASVPPMEEKCLTIDGGAFDAEISAAPFVYENRSGALVFFHDITERKRAEEEQRRSRALLSSIIEGTPDAVYVKDRAGRYLLANSATCRVAGMRLEELLGKDDTALFTPEAAEYVMALDRRVMASGKMETFEEDLTFRSGGNATFFTAKGPMVDDNGNVIGVFGIARDITDRKRSEQERSKLQEQLQQSQKMESVGRLAGGVAHDFNNLLTVINGYASLLLPELREGDPLWVPVSEIAKAGARAAGLTHQLLAFSRKQVIELKATDLNDVVGEVVKMIRRLVGEDIEVVTSLAPSLGNVLVDAGQIHQVLINLAVNARYAMPGGGKLVIETTEVEIDDTYVAAHADTKTGAYVVLSVTDNGAGMDRETQQHAFEPFFTTKPKGEGTGLGLSTVYGIVRQSGGWIWLYSEPGKGTTFKIYLPRLTDAAERGQAVRRTASSLEGTETILVVEDQADVRKLTVEVLKRHGYHVLEAANGDEALLLCERTSDPIDLMVTDVVMPGMTGRELAGRLAPLRPAMKVLYTSGYPANVVVNQGVLDPGAAYLSKPFLPESLAAKVRELLDAQRE